jgi:pimeloyl-ACP methyl ester carboxylesterase
MTYVLVPGAGGEAWYWHLVAPLLEQEVIAIELPTGDPDAGLQEYADVITAAAGDRERVTLVAQSMGAFSAPLAKLDVERIILVAPMIPAPGETPGEWWTTSGLPDAGAPPFDPIDTFFHDVPKTVKDAAFERGEPKQEDKPFADAFTLDAWPDVPTRVIAGLHDRLFPYLFLQRLARERLNVEVEPIASGHMPALSRPEELARTII